MKTKYIALLFINFFFATILLGQIKDELPKQILLDMRDGSSIQGKLIEKIGDTIVVQTVTLGTLRLNTKDVKGITPLNATAIKNGEYWFENPHATRGFFAPTGFGLRKGEGYYSNIYVALNSAAYGFTNHFTVGVGADAFTIFTGNAPILLYVTPKFSFPITKNLNLGVGVLAGSFGGSFIDNERSSAGIAYGVGTLGNRDNNLSIALGYGYSNGDWAKRPVVTFSGQLRVARKVGLMTENYVLPDIFFGTTGARFMNSNFSFDLGLLYGSLFGEDFNAFPIPFLGVAFPFGHKKL